MIFVILIKIVSKTLDIVPEPYDIIREREKENKRLLRNLYLINKTKENLIIYRSIMKKLKRGTKGPPREHSWQAAYQDIKDSLKNSPVIHYDKNGNLIPPKTITPP